MLTATTLRLRDGEIFIKVKKEGREVYGKHGAFAEQERQTFIVNIDRDAQTYTLNIIRESNPELRAENLLFPKWAV
jgi:hypothetical protein